MVGNEKAIQDALEYVVSGFNRAEVASYLIADGVPEPLAKEVTEEAIRLRRQELRTSAFREMAGFAALSLVFVVLGLLQLWWRNDFPGLLLAAALSAAMSVREAYYWIKACVSKDVESGATRRTGLLPGPPVSLVGPESDSPPDRWPPA